MDMWNWLRRRKGPEEPAANAPTEPMGPIPLSPDPPPSGAYLALADKDGRPLYAPLERSPLVVGTDAQCDLVLDDRVPGADRVAPRHARLERWQDRWVVVPLSPDAPVFVNGRRAGETALRDGATLQFGTDGVQCVFRLTPTE